MILHKKPLIGMISAFLICTLFISFGNGIAAVSGASVTVKESRVSILPISNMTRIFPDVRPETDESYARLDVPRNCIAPFQFCLIGDSDGRFEIKVSPLRKSNVKSTLDRITIYNLRTVHVEGNSQLKGTFPGKEPPKDWLPYLIRKAPFDMAEVLIENRTIDLKAKKYAGILVEVNIPADAIPGEYIGEVGVVRNGTLLSSVSVTVNVHDAVVPDDIGLYWSHWLWPEPENLSSRKPTPQWWSQEHWNMLIKAARMVREFHVNSLLTPTIFGEHPLIKVEKLSKDKYEFDYSNFDKWIETFKALGFKQFEGSHVVGRKLAAYKVYAQDDLTGNYSEIFSRGSNQDEYLRFLGVFFDNIYLHLKEKGWLELYVQHLMDEPDDYKSYETISRLFRKHMPGIKNLDAIHSWGKDPVPFSEFSDVFVFYAGLLDENKQLGVQRLSEGKENWIYWFSSPIPPQGPNTELDRPLACCRLYPWLAYYLNAQGMLHWAVNVYRGADPYATSIGPWPKPNPRYPGHPPGDNWFYYPTDDGLVGSLRLIVLREGLVDFALLRQAEKLNKHATAEVVKTILKSFKDYETEPTLYREARRKLLRIIDANNI